MIETNTNRPNPPNRILVRDIRVIRVRENDDTLLIGGEHESF